MFGAHHGEINMTLMEILDRGRQIAGMVDGAGGDELKQLRDEWSGYREQFFRLAREAEARACVDLLNYFEAVSDSIDMALLRQRKGRR